jgi:N-acetylglucosaminyldiphosphoundecaprenol N-acetyl-beta-D-mannosaminyltransferase
MHTSTPSVPIGAVSVRAMTEAQVAQEVTAAWRAGDGGCIVTVNVDILRAASRDAAIAELVAEAEIAVADGMPVVWAASMAGCPVPERVTGASLVWTLAGAAAVAGRSVYLVGGEPGVPEAAGQALAERHPGLRVVGADSPPRGFEHDERQVAALVDRVAAARPDLVLVGLGFPKQERLIARLRPALPGAWMLGCGAGIPFAAGQFRRAPQWAQRWGVEWAHRLITEPRRLARRYLAHDLPFALGLLTRALGARLALTAQPTQPTLALPPVSLPPLALVPRSADPAPRLPAAWRADLPVPRQPAPTAAGSALTADGEPLRTVPVSRARADVTVQVTPPPRRSRRK